MFLHYKPADAAGEDGDFDAKVRTLEALDERIPTLLDLDADVTADCRGPLHALHPRRAQLAPRPTDDPLRVHGRAGFDRIQ